MPRGYKADGTPCGGKPPSTRVDDAGRVCTSCGEYKSWDEYSTRMRKGVFTRYSQCKSCVAEVRIDQSHESNTRLKTRVMDAYGGKCSCCGESEMAFLTIDHVNNDGAEHRREIGSKGGRSTYYWLIKNNFPEGFQVLCANCNLAKVTNGGTCPHEGR